MEDETVVEALANQRLGREAEARGWLDKGRELIRPTGELAAADSPAIYNLAAERLQRRLLLREATAALAARIRTSVFKWNFMG